MIHVELIIHCMSNSNLQMCPTYTVTPTGPHTLKISSTLLKHNQVKSRPNPVESIAYRNRDHDVVMTASVSVQTPMYCDATENIQSPREPMKKGPESDLLKAADCCLDVASALKRSEELGRLTNSGLEGLLPDPNDKWDLNSSADLISIIATGDLFAGGKFGRETDSESGVMGAGKLDDNQLQIAAQRSTGRSLPRLMLTLKLPWMKEWPIEHYPQR